MQRGFRLRDPCLRLLKAGNSRIHIGALHREQCLALADKIPRLHQHGGNPPRDGKNDVREAVRVGFHFSWRGDAVSG